MTPEQSNTDAAIVATLQQAISIAKESLEDIERNIDQGDYALAAEGFKVLAWGFPRLAVAAKALAIGGQLAEHQASRAEWQGGDAA